MLVALSIARMAGAREFFGSFFRACEKKTHEGRRGDGVHAISPVVRAHPTFVLEMAPALLFQNLLVLHVSQNRCQKAYLLRLQSKTANDNFSN